MKTIGLAASLLLVLLAVACDGTSDSPERFELLLEVTVTGDATVSMIQVEGGESGDPVEVNPTLPYQLYTFVFEDDSVRIVVDGTANNGELSVVMQDNPHFDPSPGTYEQETCGPAVPACMIDLTHDF